MGWTWTVEGAPARCIVPAHIDHPTHVRTPDEDGTWSSGPLTIDLATMKAASTTQAEEDSGMPWADCPEARTKWSRACDRQARRS
jgi:hypothetical protein